MVLAFLFPAELVFEFARPEEAKNPSGGIVLHLIQMRLAALSFEKSRGARQAKNRDPIANSSSTNAVNFSSACTIKCPASRRSAAHNPELSAVAIRT